MVAWVGLGRQRDEVGVYGSSGALRRLAEALVAAADAADRLDVRREAARRCGDMRGHARRDEPSWAELAAGVLGWRLELTLLSVLIVAERVLAAVVGDLVAAPVVLVIGAVAVVVGPLRRASWRWLRVAPLRREWARAVGDCGLAADRLHAHASSCASEEGHNRVALRPFLDIYGERPLDCAARYPHNAYSVSAVFNDEVDDQLCRGNPFANRGQQQSLEREDIHPLTEEEVGRIAEIARERWGLRTGIPCMPHFARPSRTSAGATCLAGNTTSTSPCCALRRVADGRPRSIGAGHRAPARQQRAGLRGDLHPRLPRPHQRAKPPAPESVP